MFVRAVFGSEQDAMESTVPTHLLQLIQRLAYHQHVETGHNFCFNHEPTLSHHYHKLKSQAPLAMQSIALDKRMRATLNQNSCYSTHASEATAVNIFNFTHSDNLRLSYYFN